MLAIMLLCIKYSDSKGDVRRRSLDLCSGTRPGRIAPFSLQRLHGDWKVWRGTREVAQA